MEATERFLEKGRQVLGWGSDERLNCTGRGAALARVRCHWLPNTPARLIAAKPEFVGGEDDDLATCLLLRPRKLAITQREAGQLIGVCAATIMAWENRRLEPEDRYYPNIIAFLGHEP